MAFEFGLNDLSILIPLPHVDEKNPVITPEDVSQIALLVGANDIIPKDAYLKFGTICEKMNNDKLFDFLKIVAVRFDPCSNGSCKKQIRVVWQPVIGQRFDIKVFDCALHSFHDVDDVTWIKILNDLERISDPRVSRQPLQVHPIIKSEGLSGSYYQNLKKIITDNVHVKNISKIALTRSPGVDFVWRFEIFERDSTNNWIQLNIPTLKTSEISPVINTQRFITTDYLNSAEFFSRIKPNNEIHLDFTRYLLDSRAFVTNESEESINNLVRQINFIENPKLSHDQNSDCVKCHVTQSARIFVQQKKPLVVFNQISNSNYYSNPKFDLRNNSRDVVDVNNLRMFGYAEDTNRDLVSSISNRVINETAEAVSFVNNWIK